MRARRWLIIGAVLLVSAAGLTACGNDEDRAASPPGSPPTTALGPTAPLTGEPMDDSDKRNRPALTVKIDNHPQARPQFGIDKADVIVEEKVEGGLSRFMALFHSQDSDRVGPVRSLRSTDVMWLRPEGGLLAYSGGIDPVKAQISRAGLTDVGADSNGPKFYKRRSDRPFEHSMYTNTNTLRELTPKSATGAKPLFEYLQPGQTFGGAGAMPLSGSGFRMSGQATAVRWDWTWDAGSGLFRRGTDGAAHSIEGAGQIGMKNVIVQFTPYRATPWRDRANTPVDEAAVVGSGEAWVMSDGKIIKGRWSRPSETAITSYTDAQGAPLRLQRGRTWVSLVPPGELAEVKP